MSKVCNSWAELEMALQQAMYDAIDEATQNSYEDLKENVEHFYDGDKGIKPATYKRTGQFMNSPQLDNITHAGNTATSQISINDEVPYNPSGRDTHTIYEYAEDGGLRGYGGFWQRSMEDTRRNIADSFSKRFK